MYTLYGSKGSGSAAIEAALELAGQRYRLVQAASWEPGPGLEELALLNPLKQIPTLQLPDGTVMSESAAILIHLGLQHPGAGLLPDAPADLAQALRGLVYIAANCYAAIGLIDYPERWCEPAGPLQNEALRLGARLRLHAAWALFADQFYAPTRGQAFLHGDAPAALDLLATVVSKWSGSRPYLQQQRPEFHALLLRVERHPRLAALFARHWPPA
ncbi:glutathione S-transferase [Paucibacter sp. APW11]|uniref:Glutathione S-transferase n=1 Tax=Roseateles aquae TaxID=3077235 RepID=A0ABU3PK45_9BURK|nr:glutathione S-transferase [Paucibacter sp. APW11]MDT9002416.1 glutathione S-transferase [Paucibacter sp. APW11]